MFSFLASVLRIKMLGFSLFPSFFYLTNVSLTQVRLKAYGHIS